MISLLDTLQWRNWLLDTLATRDANDRIIVHIDCDIAVPGSMNIVADLVRGEYMVWVERSTRAVNVRGLNVKALVNVDVFQLTPAGISLCGVLGIARQ